MRDGQLRYSRQWHADPLRSNAWESGNPKIHAFKRHHPHSGYQNTFSRTSGRSAISSKGTRFMQFILSLLSPVLLDFHRFCGFDSTLTTLCDNMRSDTRTHCLHLRMSAAFLSTRGRSSPNVSSTLWRLTCSAVLFYWVVSTLFSASTTESTVRRDSEQKRYRLQVSSSSGM